MPSTPKLTRLSAERVSVHLGQRLALSQATFQAVGGSITCILGPNGSGKTTLLRALAGLLPFAGHIRFDDRELNSFSARERARLVSYVPQRSLMNAALSVEEVIGQGRFCHNGGFRQLRPLDHAAVERAVEQVDLQGYEQRPFDALSGGEQRRVLLGRALATEAAVILLDEPTAALDIRHVLQLHALLRKLADAGHCIVTVLHQLDDAQRFADQILLLNGGELVGAGLTDATLTATNVRNIYGVALLERAGLRCELDTTNTHESH